MTRTKRPRKTSSIKKDFEGSSSSHSSVASNCKPNLPRQKSDNFLSRDFDSAEHFLEEFELLYEAKLEVRHKKYKSACEHVKRIFEETRKNMPETFLNSKIRSYFDEDLLKVEDKAEGNKARPSRICKPASSTYEFKRPKTPQVSRRSSRKRSVSAPPRPQPMATPKCDLFKTPSNSLQKLGPISSITPKVSNTPMCVMRRPERGEVVFASTGSPLLVGRVSLEDIPTVTVPLQDGRIFSILPDPSAGPPCLPEFDEETKKYLKTLRQHLELLAPSSP